MKIALLAAAQNLTSFFIAQIKAEPLSKEGLSAEKGSLEEGETAESCVMMSAALPAASNVTLPG